VASWASAFLANSGELKPDRLLFPFEKGKLPVGSLPFLFFPAHSVEEVASRSPVTG
jgi:hypothetical protein